jgi:hypothetical protein
MKKKSFVAILYILILRMVGCGGEDSSEQAKEVAYVEPIKTAFESEDIGRPLDWETLREADKAFVSALWERDAAKAKAALSNGANAGIDCGYGANALMLAAATGDKELVGMITQAGVKGALLSGPYLKILNFAEDAKRPGYQAALLEIEKLTGKKPAPADREGAHWIELEADEAASFLKKHHERLLDEGCYVFLNDQHFGIGGKPDVIWILPTRDKFSVMAFTGVNGINYELENHLVIRWMERLDRKQPYLMTGCGFDFLSGRFIEKISDADQMARRMYAFCPDIVDQGTGTIERLASELRKTNELYFWWD